MKIERAAVLTLLFASCLSGAIAAMPILRGPMVNVGIGIGILVLCVMLLHLAWEIGTGRRVYRYKRPAPTGGKEASK